MSCLNVWKLIPVAPFPSSLPFISLLQYAVRGLSTLSLSSQIVTYKVKQDGYMGSIIEFVGDEEPSPEVVSS